MWHCRSRGNWNVLRWTSCAKCWFLRATGRIGFPTDDEGKDEHVGRLRRLIQKYTTDEALRREVKFVSSELLRPFPTGDDN